MVERPAAYLLSRSSGCIRSQNWMSKWKYRLHCRTSRSHSGGSIRSHSGGSIRSPSMLTYRQPCRSAACRCRYRCRWDLWSTCRRPSRSSACSRDCSTAAGRSLGIRGRRSSRCRKKPFCIPPEKDLGTSVPVSFYAACARCVSENRKTRTAHGRPGFGYKNRKKTQRLENCGARRAAFKPYFFLSFILGSRVRKPAAFSVARNSGLTLSRARATP